MKNFYRSEEIYTSFCNWLGRWRVELPRLWRLSLHRPIGTADVWSIFTKISNEEQDFHVIANEDADFRQWTGQSRDENPPAT